MNQAYLKYCFLVLSLTFFYSFLLAQNAQIRVQGNVKDAESRQVLEFARVSLRSLPDSTVKAGMLTDAKGRFSLEVEPGRYLLQIDFLGYATRQLPAFDLRLEQDPYQAGEIFLNPDVTTLDAVEITSEKSQVEFALDKKVFNVGQDINRIGGNASDILDNIPSVTVDVDGNVHGNGRDII